MGLFDKAPNDHWGEGEAGGTAYYYAGGAKQRFSPLCKTLKQIDNAGQQEIDEATSFYAGIIELARELDRIDSQLMKISNGELRLYDRWTSSSFSTKMTDTDPRRWGLGLLKCDEDRVWTEVLAPRQSTAEQWVVDNLPGDEGWAVRNLVERRRSTVDALRKASREFDEYASRAQETLRRQKIVRQAGLLGDRQAAVSAEDVFERAKTAKASLEAVSSAIDIAYFGLEERSAEHEQSSSLDL